MNRMIEATKITLIKRSVSFIRYIMLVPAILITQISFAQFTITNNAQDKFRAVHWSLAEGLSQAEVYNMIKDANGFLWIGTANGLNRFDGSRFKIFFHDPDDSSTIGGNNIHGIVEDSLHNIWIGTDKGLSRYDTRADTFTNFIVPAKNGTANFNVIRPLCASRDEVFCEETDSRIITAYNVHSFKKRTLLKLDAPDVLLHLCGFHFDTATNSLWAVSRKGADAGLIQIDTKDGRKTHYRWPCYKKITGHNHESAICYDPKRNSFWINSQDGLIEFTLADKQFHHVDAFNSWVNLKDFGALAGIDTDNEGRIWLSTYPKGIIIYDPSDGSVKLPFNDHPDLQKEVSDELIFLYIDKENIVWTGYWSRKGLYQTIPQETVVTRYAVDTAKSFTHLVGNFVNGENGKLWISYSEGLLVFDPPTGMFEALHGKDLPGISGDAIFPIAMDATKSKAWLLTLSHNVKTGFGSLYEMDVATKKCQPVSFKDPSGNTIPPSEFFIIPSVMEFNLTPFRNGCIVVAIHNQKECLFIVNDEKPVANQILSFPEFTFTPFIGTDGEHFLFLKSRSNTLNFSFTDLNSKWTKIATPLDSIKWDRITYNKSDLSYWVIAFQQLLHYDKNFKLIKRYTLKDGLPELQIYSLGPDNKGNIWFNTDRSIYQLNVETGKITILSEKDGFMPQNFTPGEESRIKDDKGNIYFPSGFFGKGFDRVNPDRFVSSPSYVYLKSIEINQQPLSLSTSSNNIGELSLRYFENKISIETGIIDFYSKGQSRIRYKLEDLDTTWHYGPNYHTVSYERIPPGKYKLVMQASNAANEFNGPEKILYMHISPAFWNTWWFRTLVVIFTAALLYAFIQYRSRTLKRNNFLLEKKVTLRTNELNNSLAELKTAQDQLIQSEKMASLGELTSGIAHEIKNPLNFINNFSEINMELISEIEEEQIPVLTENNRDEMIPLIKTLKKNSDKINHHGKRIDEIVKGMLQHSRLGNVNKEPVNINVLCDESLKLAYHGFKAKEKTFNASFETRFDPTIPQIRVIPQDVGRVLLNLINNAFYTVNEKNKKNHLDTPDTLETESLYKPSVIVSTKKMEDKIFITISDNGMGIPSQILNKIFQPFFTTKPTGEGTGLGLSMSYDIISKGHGGEIRAKSKEGLGTDFEVVLPI